MSGEEKVDEMCRLMKEIAVELVDQPRSVAVSYALHGTCVALQVSADPDDMRYLIGKDGRTVKSLRTIVVAMGRRDQVNYEFNVSELPSNKGKGSDL